MTDHSISGSYILEGYLLPYPMTSNKFLEINYHLTVSGPLLKKALDIAIKQASCSLKVRYSKTSKK